MSNAYPSRRELRLQREREARAKLRDAEVQRWTEEVEQRHQEPDETPEPILLPIDDTVATGQEEADQEDLLAPGRRASARPVDDPSEVEDPEALTAAGSRRRRRADSEVTSTGMLPIISKPRDDQKAPKPTSRREARELEVRRAAQRRAEIERLQQVQGELEEPKPLRRATAPQTTPPPVPVVVEEATEPETQQPEFVPEDSGADEALDVEITAIHEVSATEITDMSGLDTIEIRRAELRAETERLTREIIQLGESNPNVIDPQLLRRQKELAEKSQELQSLETAAIEIVESEKQDTPADSTEAVSASPAEETAKADSVDEAPPAQDADTAAVTQPRQDKGRGSGRRRRRTTDGPFVTGPFEVTDDDSISTPDTSAKETKPPLAEFIRAPLAPEPERDPRQPVDASSAHGLDTLDAKDVEAPERRLITSAAIMFAIGVIALIVAIILLTR